ncbi:UNVERIFIED_CONTAM: hypothetical protein PYX00_006416 [Menopon gallinae]|uniref:Pro-resilin-like n=1 Tax=Menopon gallinae TaxID=328185 RepID=A0AAW2HV89_9NEOP
MVAADVSEIVGQNQYLPPSKGYNYDRPSVPFPSPTRPAPSRPTPSYQPPASPSYIPPVTARPASPRPQPSGPAYQPGATSGHGALAGHEHDHHHEPGMPYDFEYKVKDDYFGTDYSRNEVSDGDIIRGEYRVQLPDGRLQIVKYTADWKNGYNADVSYQGEPNFPSASGSASYPASGQPGSSYGPPSSGGY